MFSSMSVWVSFIFSSLSVVSLQVWELSCLLCKHLCLQLVRETISQIWVNKRFCSSKSHHKALVVFVIDIVLAALKVATPVLFHDDMFALHYMANMCKEKSHWFWIDSKHHASVITKANARERLFNFIFYFSLLI